MPKTILGVTIPTLVDFLVDVVEGKVHSEKHVEGKVHSEKHDLAVEILRYVQQQQAAKIPEDIIEHDAYRLWHFDEPKYYGVTPCHLKTVTDQNGVERLVIVSEPVPDSKSGPAPAPISAQVAPPQPEQPKSSLETLCVEAAQRHNERIRQQEGK